MTNHIIPIRPIISYSTYTTNDIIPIRPIIPEYNLSYHIIPIWPIIYWYDLLYVDTTNHHTDMTYNVNTTNRIPILLIWPIISYWYDLTYINATNHIIPQYDLTYHTPIQVTISCWYNLSYTIVPPAPLAMIFLINVTEPAPSHHPRCFGLTSPFT